ncbi:hypothetical protein BDN70DRAFT_873077 [Pholiota conissans]|uniref:Ribosomal RNA-processing protein 8 n=1 Tax=Pholiota conissans TaxID=109636 RepID=A0A9P5ZBQ9_9AGAR|nr:hypothetical protein BDN70DRAFT_873077 [Pholiota conissans]
MSLFEVPGWSVKTTPVRGTPQQLSKKRKRPNNDVETAQVNMEKLMAKLANTTPEHLLAPKKHRKAQKQAQGAPSDVERHTEGDQITAAPSKASLLKAKKEQKKKKHIDSFSKKPSTSLDKPPQPCDTNNLTALQKSMKDSLDGARFRLINENLYKTDSHEAQQMMKNDPKVFEEYHTGFRHQVVSWPINPVDHYVSTFTSYPPKTLIADLGCGDAVLAKKLLSTGISVISFDLISGSGYVVEADICDKIPLPGSEGFNKDKSTGDGQVVDVVVCALSLMGVNWPNCIREAWRILKTGGELHIAEVTSRFTDIEQFQNLLGSLGFRLRSKNDSISSHFILFEFTKVPRANKSDKEWQKLLAKGALLKPCEYKRR